MTTKTNAVTPLVACLLKAPSDQVDERILAEVKAWGVLPTKAQVDSILVLAGKFPTSRLAKRLLAAIAEEINDQ